MSFVCQSSSAQAFFLCGLRQPCVDNRHQQTVAWVLFPSEGQTVLYRLFDWMSQPAARLVVVVRRCKHCTALPMWSFTLRKAIANTIDLPERLLPRVSRLCSFAFS